MQNQQKNVVIVLNVYAKQFNLPNIPEKDLKNILNRNAVKILNINI